MHRDNAVYSTQVSPGLFAQYVCSKTVDLVMETWVYQQGSN